MQDFLGYCQHLAPQSNQPLGMIFKEKRDFKAAAFDFLEKNDFDFLKAKFYLTFPIMHKHKEFFKYKEVYSK